MIEDERVQIQNVIRARFPRASTSFIEANTQIHPQKPEPRLGPPLGNALSRKEKGAGRITVRYRISRVRPLDFENAPSGTKPITDALRRCGLIPGDSPEEIKYELEQKRVQKYSQEQTEIEIIYP